VKIVHEIVHDDSVLARFNSNPGPIHWKAVKHLFRYLKGTLDLKLTYGPTGDKSQDLILTYSDADHRGNSDNGKSTGGYLVKLGTGAVSWSSKLQTMVALSTTEAEYIYCSSGGSQRDHLDVPVYGGAWISSLHCLYLADGQPISHLCIKEP